MQFEQQLKNPMDRISQLLNAGHVGEAEQFCRDFLESHADDINVMGMFGAILLRQRKVDEAERTLKRTIELAPTFAKPHEDLGMLYLSRKNAANAIPLLEQAIKLDPNSPSAFFTLAHALAQLGRGEDAEAAHQKYLALSPATQVVAKAAELLEQGQHAEAETVCDEILSREPENVEALRMLARIASEDDRHVIAEGLLRRIIKIAPDSLRHYLDLARFLVDRSRFPEVLEVCDQATNIDPDDASIHVLRGDALSVIGRAAEALDAYERCLASRDDDPQALIGRGHILRVLGQRSEAIGSYEKCIQLRPHIGDAWWSLASLKDFEFNEQQHQHMQSELASDDMDARNETFFRFALARSYEQRGDFDRAWRELLSANEVKRGLVSYDPVETESQHDKLIDVFSKDFCANERQSTPDSSTPIFILGMPRSGSTLIEQILASHSQVEGTGELPYILMISQALAGSQSDQLRYPSVLRDMSDKQLSSMGLSYLHHSQTHRQSDTKVFTDKMPSNFSHVGFISLVLPNAKIIDARREPLDTCVANFRQLYASGKNHTYDLQELGEYYLQYIRMMNHWNAAIPGRVLTVQYEDVVSDLEGQVRRILEHCGLGWEDACLDYHKNSRPVNTASSEQVRQPIYKDAVGFWRNYESQLQELAEILEPVLK